MRRTTVPGLAGGMALLLLQATPAGAQEERGPIVPVFAQVSPQAPRMPALDRTVLTGDFAGDTQEEILAYTLGSVSDPLVAFDNGGTDGDPLTWQVHQHSVSGLFTPVVGDFDGDGHDDILWHAATAGGRSYLWEFSDFDSVTSTTVSVGGNYFPFAGDLTGDGADDVFWYGFGTRPDYVWEFDPGGTHTSRAVTVDGTYVPVVGSFADDATDDVLWYSAGEVPGPDTLWDFAPDPTTTVAYTSRSMPVSGSYHPLALDEWNDGAGGDDIVWVAWSAPDNVWDFQDGALRRWVDRDGPDDPGFPVAGDFLGDGHEDILWTRAGDAMLWDHAPDASDDAQLTRWTYLIRTA
jgi:VCBS repeat protein